MFRGLANYTAGPRDRRILMVVTLASSTGKGVYLSAGVLFFTQIVNFSVLSVGVGLSLAGAVSIGLGIVAGIGADMFGARSALVLSQLLCAAAILYFLLVQSYWQFLLATAVAAATLSALPVVSGPLINSIDGVRPSELRAYLRATTNVGITIGAACSAWAATVGSRGLFEGLFVGAAFGLIVSAACALWLPKFLPTHRRSGKLDRKRASRDYPYLVLAILDGIMSMQYKVLPVVLPLWIITQTSSPHSLVSIAIIANTVIVVLFQVRISRGITSVHAGGTALKRSGFAFFASSILIAWSAGLPVWVSAVLILIAVVVHSVGELWQAGGGFELSMTLAEPASIGQYLGIFRIGNGLAESVGPALLTWLCIELGKPGWFILGGVFLATGFAAPFITRWVVSTRSQYAPGSTALEDCAADSDSSVRTRKGE